MSCSMSATLARDRKKASAFVGTAHNNNTLFLRSLDFDRE
jgi:hypothetical protein